MRHGGMYDVCMCVYAGGRGGQTPGPTGLFGGRADGGRGGGGLGGADGRSRRDQHQGRHQTGERDTSPYTYAHMHDVTRDKQLKKVAWCTNIALWEAYFAVSCLIHGRRGPVLH